MLLAVLGGLTANLAALEAVLSATARAGAHRIIALGEVEPKGPDLAATRRRLATTPEILWLRRRSTPAERVFQGKVQALEWRDAPPLEPAPLPGRTVVAVEGTGKAEVHAASGWVVISLGQIGGAVQGDPRASFILVELDVAEEAPVWIEHIGFDLERTLLATRRAVHEARLPDREAAQFLRAFLGRDAALLEPVRRDDDPASALIKLLSPRIRDVYRRATERHLEDPVEHVHQVRVATRRLRAALEVAGPLLEGPAATKCQECLRRFGAALGRARRADVLLAHINAIRAEGEREQAVKRRLEALIVIRQRRARRALAKHHGRHKLIKEGIRLTSVMMQPKHDPPRLKDALLAELRRRAAAMRRELRAIERPDDDDGLHQLRIAAKRLRYTSELAVGPLAGLEATSTTERLRGLQDALGELHDGAELLSLIESPRARRKVSEQGRRALAEKLGVQQRALRERALPGAALEAEDALSAIERVLEAWWDGP